MHIRFLMLYLMIILMDLFGNTTAILDSIVSNNYYGMLRGQISMCFKMAAVSPERSIELNVVYLCDRTCCTAHLLFTPCS